MSGLEGPPVNNALLPWRIDIDPYGEPTGQTNWSTIAVAVASIKNGAKQSAGTQNDEIYWDVLLAAGTWNITVGYRKAASRGIFSVQLDGVEISTIDSYAAVTTENQVTTLTGVVVASPGIKRLKLKMTDKNASSSSYIGSIFSLGMRRTA